MSRIGKAPIPIPSGVDISVAGNEVTVKGPKGSLFRRLPSDITVRQDGAQMLVERPDDEREHRALHGLTRSLVNNMVVGVTDGFSKDQEIVGQVAANIRKVRKPEPYKGKGVRYAGEVVQRKAGKAAK